MKLTQKNLEQYAWLFSASLGLMVREHECSGGKWDVELDSYRNVNVSHDRRLPVQPPLWEYTQEVFNSADTLTELLVSNPELLTVTDWIHGDNVNFL